jgi:hypothetical protein
MTIKLNGSSSSSSSSSSDQYHYDFIKGIITWASFIQIHIYISRTVCIATAALRGNRLKVVTRTSTAQLITEIFITSIGKFLVLF